MLSFLLTLVIGILALLFGIMIGRLFRNWKESKKKDSKPQKSIRDITNPRNFPEKTDKS